VQLIKEPNCIKGKMWRYRHNTYVAPLAANAAAAALLCQPIGRWLSLRPQRWPMTKQPYAARVCHLLVSTPVIHVITCNYIYMNCYSFTDPAGMEGCVGLVSWPIVDTLPTKWSHVNQAKVRKSSQAKDRRPNHWASPPASGFSTRRL